MSFSRDGASYHFGCANHYRIKHHLQDVVAVVHLLYLELHQPWEKIPSVACMAVDFRPALGTLGPTLLPLGCLRLVLVPLRRQAISILAHASLVSMQETQCEEEPRDEAEDSEDDNTDEVEAYAHAVDVAEEVGTYKEEDFLLGHQVEDDAVPGLGAVAGKGILQRLANGGTDVLVDGEHTVAEDGASMSPGCKAHSAIVKGATVVDWVEYPLTASFALVAELPG